MRHRPPATALWTGALLLAVATGEGCSAGFDPYERLTSLRVLALQSEPVAPAPGENTTLSALVYTPPPADATMPTTVSYEWSWCPFAGTANDGYPCLVTEDQLTRLLGMPVSFALGTDPTVKFTHMFDPALLQTICAGQPGLPPPPDCREGFPVTLKLRVSTGSEQVTAVRPLKLLLKAAAQPNTNPALGPDMVATIDGNDVALPESKTLPSGTVAADLPLLKRRADNAVKANVTVDAAEVYDAFDDNGNPASVTERLFVSWFVETGTMKHPRTGYNAATTIPFDSLLTNVWRPDRAQLYRRDTAQLFVVLRDSRDGVTWRSFTVGLEPSP